MLQKTMTFTNWNGEKVSETFYFNISKAEITEMEMNNSQMAKDGNITGGIKAKYDKIREGGKGSEMLKAFKEIIFMSYGEKSEDGRFFRKSAQISSDFESTPAYSELFMDLTTSEKSITDFMNKVLPADIGGGDADKPSGPMPMSPAQRAEREASRPVTITQDAVAPQGPTPEQIQAYLDANPSTSPINPDAV